MKAETFTALREANIARLPRFKNKLGEPAHSQPDGSDWALSTWCNAVLGELGELANLIKKVERGDLTLEAARNDLRFECADVLTYLDILAFRLGVDLGFAYRVGYDAHDAKLALEGNLPLSTRCVAVAVPFGRMMEMVKIIESKEGIASDSWNGWTLGRVVMWLDVLSICIGGCLDDDVVEKFNLVSARVGAGVWIAGSGRNGLPPLELVVEPR